MATKAVHLEVVSDLSADAFLAAFRRFISRRGNPTNMFSDNATNFKGASSYLKEQLKLIKSVEVQNFVTQESITWHFIPPTAPHIGGLWEAGIKSTKQLLINPPTRQHGFFHPTREASKTDHTEFFLRPGTHQK
ncbi:uncharacterized protein TNCV_2194581 [Trichonephila clavipes]|uniref:Integrase catalytic domain-containing protein n=1 Tax=Trichonephila clavipes TaxID=2585209 RepID=A0A8X6SAZ0_TRICX|nr:uncharacterized protein TNCV_2194581 [Trichonephila clavipes]